MKYTYTARTQAGELRTGALEAVTDDVAVATLQRRGLVVVSLKKEEEKPLLASLSLAVFERVSQKDVVILSRQMATMFAAKVPVVESLKVIISEMESPVLRREMTSLLDDIQGGASMSQAMARYPKVFSPFYVSMVRAGEESGKLDDTFTYLADYLERSYELTMKARNALIYPAFVIITFFVVMTLMFVVIMPQLTPILLEVGGELPIYTRIMLGISDFLRQFGILLFLAGAGIGLVLWRYYQTAPGRLAIHRFQIAIPFIGALYKKLYMARITSNLDTLLSGGIPVIRALEVTSDVVGNEMYRRIILDAIASVQGGSLISAAFAEHADIPPLVSQMIRIGEETGRLDVILGNLSKFYQREVDSAVENLVSLIEPVMIVVLGGGVALLVASILLPIYSITAQF